MNVISIFLVGAGGCLGSIARYMAVISIDKRLNSFFPYGTLTVNLVGSFILGFVTALILKKTGADQEQWRLFLGTGFCGGFTTFSAFAAENMSLFEHRSPGTALTYIAISMIGGLLAVWSGFAVAKSVL